MAYSLENVVPWGRTLAEYTAMFDLSSADLEKQIVGCGDGPASFNRELSQLGGRVVSVDPLYQFSAEKIAQRIEAIKPMMADLLRENLDEFVWTWFSSPEHLEQTRIDAMNQFLGDFANADAQGRYVQGSLPSLDFADRQFELALCSHFLFLYSEQFDADFHVAAILEMCRVASEARIFPVLELGSKRSRHLDDVIERLVGLGFSAELSTVNYEFQRGGNQMLRVKEQVS